MWHDPAEHEPLTDAPFERDAAQAFIVETLRIVEAQYDAASGWPLHHEDDSNIALFLRAPDLMSESRQAALPARIRTMLERYAIVDGDVVNWWSYGKPNERNRMQWCHGAPGIITSLARLEAMDDALHDLLRRGGSAAWQAGPLAKGPTLCHARHGRQRLRLLGTCTPDRR